MKKIVSAILSLTHLSPGDILVTLMHKRQWLMGMEK